MEVQSDSDAEPGTGAAMEPRHTLQLRSQAATDAAVAATGGGGAPADAAQGRQGGTGTGTGDTGRGGNGAGAGAANGSGDSTESPKAGAAAAGGRTQARSSSRSRESARRSNGASVDDTVHDLMAPYRIADLVDEWKRHEQTRTEAFEAITATLFQQTKLLAVLADRMQSDTRGKK